MFLSLGLAFWGLVRDRRCHGRVGPLVLAALGAVALVAGVIVVHGASARLLINSGAVSLFAATVWNVRERKTSHPSPLEL